MTLDPLAMALMQHHPEYYTGPPLFGDTEPEIEAKTPGHDKKKTVENVWENPTKRDVLMIASSDKITMDKIMQACVDASGISPSGKVTSKQLISPRRMKHLVHWRHIVCFLTQEHTELSLPLTGRLLGKRDHSTVWSSLKRVNGNPPEFAADIALVEKLLKIRRDDTEQVL